MSTLIANPLLLPANQALHSSLTARTHVRGHVAIAMQIHLRIYSTITFHTCQGVVLLCGLSATRQIIAAMIYPHPPLRVSGDLRWLSCVIRDVTAHAWGS